KVGTAFATLVPQVDADGNETAGIRMPSVQAPLGAYTGWNLRTRDIGAPDELFSMVGSYLPFARTKADRMKHHDSRPSIEERYANREEYLRKVQAAAHSLVASGYLLEQDVPALVDRAKAEWDRI
ncbi:MAG: alpha/beta hydrolase domain-containing protein, partial [Bryobacteraceae bacterium]